jgi:hypothetical protein
MDIDDAICRDESGIDPDSTAKYMDFFERAEAIAEDVLEDEVQKSTREYNEALIEWKDTVCRILDSYTVNSKKLLRSLEDLKEAIEEQHG